MTDTDPVSEARALLEKATPRPWSCDTDDAALIATAPRLLEQLCAEGPEAMIWTKTHRRDCDVVPLADRHYNRRKHGSPQFAPPGRCLVLRHGDPVCAFWITSWPFAQFVRHAWAGAWVCSAFRRESGPLASEMIRDAVAATRWYYGDPPPQGMITFVDRDKTRSKRDPGRCYRRAGFKVAGETRGGLVALQLLGADMPFPVAPLGCAEPYKEAATSALHWRRRTRTERRS